MRLAGCRAELFVLDQHLTSLERELIIRRQAQEADALRPDTRARLRREIESLDARRNRAFEEMEAVESRCLDQL